MLSFQSQNYLKKISDWLGVFKKTDPDDGKPTYFQICLHSSYMYYNECIKLTDIKNLPFITIGLQCLCLSERPS